MPKKDQEYPHVISFRLTDEAWLRVQEEIKGSGLTPHDWCREVVMEVIGMPYPLSKSERLIMDEMARIHYLVLHGFKLMADGKLTPDEWKRYRSAVFDEPEKVAENLMMKIEERERLKGYEGTQLRSSRMARGGYIKSENGHAEEKMLDE